MTCTWNLSEDNMLAVPIWDTIRPVPDVGQAVLDRITALPPNLADR